MLLVGQQGYTGGANGITDFKSFLGWNINTDDAKVKLYFAQVLVLFVVMGVGTFIIKSRLGKILIAIRDREVYAELAEVLADTHRLSVPQVIVRMRGYELG